MLYARVPLLGKIWDTILDISRLYIVFKLNTGIFLISAGEILQTPFDFIIFANLIMDVMN